MLRNSACALFLTVLAVAGAPDGRASHLSSMHPPLFHHDDCGRGLRHHCFGAGRDFHVDRLYRVSCSEARDILEDRGFRRIKTLSCGSRYHKFAARWKGKSYTIRVSRSTGDITSMRRLN